VIQELRRVFATCDVCSKTSSIFEVRVSARYTQAEDDALPTGWRSVRRVHPATDRTTRYHYCGDACLDKHQAALLDRAH
jgi:hypothetical protein